jgi:hypothetical protein
MFCYAGKICALDLVAIKQIATYFQFISVGKLLYESVIFYLPLSAVTRSTPDLTARASHSRSQAPASTLSLPLCL